MRYAVMGITAEGKHVNIFKNNQNKTLRSIDCRAKAACERLSILRVGGL